MQERIFGLTIRAQKQPNKTRMTISVTNVDENGPAKRAGAKYLHFFFTQLGFTPVYCMQV